MIAINLRFTAIALVIIAGACAAVVSVDKPPHRYQAFCNYPCENYDCPDPTIYGIAACSRTYTGGCNSETPRGCWSQGAFPMLNADGKAISNGGLPQLANLTLHLEKLTEGLAHFMPDVNFDGNAVLDFEAWTPVFDQNDALDPNWHGLVYQLESISLVQQRNPNITNATLIREMAKNEFETAGIAFFETTLTHLRALRPRARWGFYGLPQGMYGTACAMTPAGQRCGYQSPILGALLRAENDKLASVWRASVALYPSIYLPQQRGTPSAAWQELKMLYVNDTISETVRLANEFGLPGSLPPVLGFTWALYHNGTTYLLPEDVQMTITQSYHPPLSVGTVIWGGGTAQVDAKLPSFIKNTEGPLYEAAQKDADECAASTCSGRGWCLQPFATKGSACVCDPGYSVATNCSTTLL